MTTTHVPERFPEIDVARGIAVVMMVFFHIAFDLYFLNIMPVAANSLPWRVFAMSTAGLFLFLVGVSLSISAGYARKRLSRNEFIKKYLKRGAGIFAIGIAITLVTWIILPGYFIIFGISAPDRACHSPEPPLYRIFMAEPGGRIGHHPSRSCRCGNERYRMASLAWDPPSCILQYRLYSGVSMAGGGTDRCLFRHSRIP